MKKTVKTFLITGVAGFIGYSFAKKLLHNSHKVIGIDNYDNYYSVKLKKSVFAFNAKMYNANSYKNTIFINLC